MKYYNFIKTKDLHKQRGFNVGGDVRQVIADHQYDDTDEMWREKSLRMQARRWRKIKNQLA
ncbi:MAG TPA: hypothetical protein VLF39_02955 [Candidatus Saccharimonadales bacterium]|nr:hypothetical protein [Candidatus Saccharimonadales bacterium]